MKILFVWNVLMVCATLVSSTYVNYEELREADEILRELENGGQDEVEIDCDEVCDTSDVCNCKVPDCIPITCADARDDHLYFKKHKDIGKPTHVRFGVRFCRRRMTRRHNRRAQSCRRRMINK